MRNVFKASCRIGLSLLIASLMLFSAAFAQPALNAYGPILAELDHGQVTPLQKELISSYSALKAWSQSELEDDYILEDESEMYSSLHMSTYTFEDLENRALSE